MNELMLQGNLQGACENLQAIYVSKDWKTEYGYNEFVEYCRDRWGLTEMEQKYMIRYANFKSMCREARLPIPPTWRIVKPILGKRQKDWLDIWKVVTDDADGQLIDHKHVLSSLERHDWIRPKSLPQKTLDKIRYGRAVNQMNSITNVENVIGVVDPEKHRAATNKAIDIDQEVMNR